MNARSSGYLAELGIPVYVRRRPSPVPGGVPEPLSVGATPFADAAAEPVERSGVKPQAALAASTLSGGDAWPALEAEVRDCTRCALHCSRTQTVFGVGDRSASLLIVGEAPGQEEDRRGEPFVGPAGQLLDAMLRAIGWSRERVFIANILKCRPPGNRDPRPEEAEACSSFLDRQIALIEPRAMLAVGRISAQRLLASDQPVGKLRGVVHRYGPSATPLVVTYHPAYLLRTPAAKAKSWQDLCMILPFLASST